jgi:ferredoxin
MRSGYGMGGGGGGMGRGGGRGMGGGVAAWVAAVVAAWRRRWMRHGWRRWMRHGAGRRSRGARFARGALARFRPGADHARDPDGWPAPGGRSHADQPAADQKKGRGGRRAVQGVRPVRRGLSGGRDHLESGAARVDPAMCVGCGICATTCPEGAVRLQG